jgi:uncharacterized protein (TIGR02444 family)
MANRAPTPLWTFAVEAYGRPDAQAACLALQDDHGVNVSYLLWAAWGEAEGLPLDLTAGASLALTWEAGVSAPLRLARRALKPEWAQVQGAAREALRDEVKRLELSAERLLFDSLASLSPGPAPVSLVEAAAHWRRPPPAQAVARLNAAITNPVYGHGSERGE